MYTYTDMGSKTISLNDEAYTRLRAAKGEGESFSDVVLRMTNADTDVLAGFGAWRETGAPDRARETQNHLNESFEERTDRLADRQG